MRIVDRRLRAGRHACALAVAGAPLLLPAGCVGPFGPSPHDYGPRPALERTRIVEGVEFSKVSTEQQEAQRTLPQRLDEPEQLEISIEEVRAWTLRNNLDLQVAMYDPALAGESVSEEEARFEATIFADVRAQQLDQPVASQLSGSAVESIDVNAGVRIPLRTGGSVEVSLPFNRTKTNNQFSLLNPSFTSDFQVSITQPLLRNAGRRASTHFIRIAALQQDVASARTKLQVIQTLAAAERAYWLLYAARRELEVRQQQYELAMEQLERARRRVQAGMDPEIEIVRAEEGVAQRLEAIIVAENNVRQQERELKRIMNRPDLPMGSATALIPTTQPDPVQLRLDESALVQEALAQRMELLELELQLAIDDSTIDFNRNQALPQLNVTGTYRRNGLGNGLASAVDQLRGERFEDWIFSLNAEAPIGNQAAESRLRRSMLQRLQRIATRRGRELTIEQEVRDAIDEVDAAWRRVLAAQQSAILAGRTLAAEQRQFEVGARTSTEVLEAAARLADAQSAEIRAITDYQIAQINLATATGVLLGASKVDWAPIALPEKPSGAPRVGGGD